MSDQTSDSPPLQWPLTQPTIVRVDGVDTWTFEEINKFISHPQQTVPGTKMTFVGLKKPDDRANVIAYLRTQSDSPVPLPQ